MLTHTASGSGLAEPAVLQSSILWQQEQNKRLKSASESERDGSPRNEGEEIMSLISSQTYMTDSI